MDGLLSIFSFYPRRRKTRCVRVAIVSCSKSWAGFGCGQCFQLPDAGSGISTCQDPLISSEVQILASNNFIFHKVPLLIYHSLKVLPLHLSRNCTLIRWCRNNYSCPEKKMYLQDKVELSFFLLLTAAGKTLCGFRMLCPFTYHILGLC